jgi:DNA repair protein RecN (Recombination protein N)
MLRELRIRNLAVVAAVVVDFGPGLSVLTGETGAGKAIVIEAVGGLLGDRASGDLVRTGERQATLEAVFDEAGAEIVVRREITNGGRSRSFVNGAPATAAALRDLSRRLVEIHGQHAHQALLDPSTHLPLLDTYAGLEAESAAVRDAWMAVAQLREQLQRAGMDAKERSARRDLVAFQLAEIDRVSPAPGEDEALESSRQILKSADRLQRLCTESYADLYEGEEAALAALARVRRRVSELADIEPAFVPYAEGHDGIKSQLEDLALFLRDYRDRIDASPERLQQVEDRLAAIERLKRKYGPGLDEVVARADALRRERAWLDEGADAGGQLTVELEAQSQRFLDAARTLSIHRRNASRRFVEEMEQLLAELAMAQTRIDFRFTDLERSPEQWSRRGIDEAEVYISANPGEDVRPLARTVSGGELSRVMLALKSLSARTLTRAGEPPDGAAPGRTLVFDEVDAGIGGRVADVVGEHLQRLGLRFQVLCITHLPQIAARGQSHLRIDKAVQSGRTVTRVQPLGPDARVEELSRMLGGDGAPGPLLDGARSLLERAHAAGAAGAADSKGAKAKGERAKGESESPARSGRAAHRDRI